MNFLDGAVRVPLLVRTPETVGTSIAGTVNDSPAEWIDIGPTLVEAAGGELEHRQFGRSLLPALDGRRHRHDAITEFLGEIMLMTDEWKLVINRYAEPYLLFNRKDDPDEQNNLVMEPGTEQIQRELKLRMFDRVMQSQVHFR